jgi:hypothetical protein
MSLCNNCISNVSVSENEAQIQKKQRDLQTGIEKPG